jgi:hypothetical protein
VHRTTRSFDEDGSGRTRYQDQFEVVIDVIEQGRQKSPSQIAKGNHLAHLIAERNILAPTLRECHETSLPFDNSNCNKYKVGQIDNCLEL